MPTFKSLAERRSFWKQHVTAYHDSGLSKASYCREHQLTYHQLIYWLSKFESQPVTCVPPPNATSDGEQQNLSIVAGCVPR